MGADGARRYAVSQRDRPRPVAVQPRHVAVGAIRRELDPVHGGSALHGGGARRRYRLGQGGGRAFGGRAAADAGEVVVRYKPSEDRIVSGGLPGIPALPAGPSVWRYLSLEAAGATAPAGLTLVTQR